MKRSILCLVPFLLLSAPQRAISQIVYELPNSSAGLAASTFPVNPTYLPSPSFPAGSTITYGTPSLVVTKPAGVRFNSPIVVGPASCGFASVRPGGLTFDPIFPARVFATDGLRIFVDAHSNYPAAFPPVRTGNLAPAQAGFVGPIMGLAYDYLNAGSFLYVLDAANQVWAQAWVPFAAAPAPGTMIGPFIAGAGLPPGNLLSDIAFDATNNTLWVTDCSGTVQQLVRPRPGVTPPFSAVAVIQTVASWFVPAGAVTGIAVDNSAALPTGLVATGVPPYPARLPACAGIALGAFRVSVTDGTALYDVFNAGTTIAPFGNGPMGIAFCADPQVVVNPGNTFMLAPILTSVYSAPFVAANVASGALTVTLMNAFLAPPQTAIVAVDLGCPANPPAIGGWGGVQTWFLPAVPTIVAGVPMYVPLPLGGAGTPVVNGTNCLLQWVDPYSIYSDMNNLRQSS